MESNLILFCLIGGVVYVDTDVAGQFNISQPLISCTVAGVIFGNMTVGLTIGVLLQLPYLVEIPAGGVKISLGNMGAYVAVGLALVLTQIYPAQSNIILTVSILFGIILSRITIPFQKWLRQLNYELLKFADKAAESGDLKRLSFLNYIGVLIAYLFGVVFSAIFIIFGKYICILAIELVPLRMDEALQFIKPVLLGAGLGALFWHFIKRRTIQFAFIGLFFGGIMLLIKLTGM